MPRVHIDTLDLDEQNLREAKDNIRRGQYSQTEGPLKVYRRDGSEKYELANGYHRLVEGMDQGREEFDVEVAPEVLPRRKGTSPMPPANEISGGAMTTDSRRAHGRKFAPAGGPWVIEVDGNPVFDFPAEDEAEARLAYNQLKRTGENVVLRRQPSGKGGGSPIDTKGVYDREERQNAKEAARQAQEDAAREADEAPLFNADPRWNEAFWSVTLTDGTVRDGITSEALQILQDKGMVVDAQPMYDPATEAWAKGGKANVLPPPGNLPEKKLPPLRFSGGGISQTMHPPAPPPRPSNVLNAEGEVGQGDVGFDRRTRHQANKATVQTNQGTAVGVPPGTPAAQPPPAPPPDPTLQKPPPTPGMPDDPENMEGKSDMATGDIQVIVQALRDMGIRARVQDAEFWPPEDQQAVLAWIEGGGDEPEVLRNLPHLEPEHVVGKAAPAGESMPAQEQKASPLSSYLQTLKDVGQKVRDNPKEARELYHGADAAQAEVMDWIEGKEADLAAFALGRWNESFDPEIMEKASEDGTLDRFKESLHDLMTELADLVSEADHAFEAVTNSTDDEGIDEDDWADYIVTQDSLERFMQDIGMKFHDLQEEFYQEIGEDQVAKSEEENAAFETAIEEAIEELESIEDIDAQKQRADEFNDQFRQDGNVYRLVFEGNEWRFNDVETLQDEGYDVKGRHARAGKSNRWKSALAGSARSHRAARRKASPTSFIETLSSMIEDAGSPAAHQAVDEGFKEATKFLNDQGKSAVDDKIKEWGRSFGKEAVDVSQDAIAHFKDDVRGMLSEIHTALEVAVNSYKATSAAGVSGDPEAVEDAMGDYQAAASELESLMDSFDQRFGAAAASCERAIMAGRGQVAYESVMEKSGARRRKRDYVAELKAKLPAIKAARAKSRKGAAPAGATFPASRIIPATAKIYAVAKKAPCCGKTGCECGCHGGRCYAIKYAPGMEALDTDAQRVMDKVEGPKRGIVLDKGAMSASCILCTSAQDREGDIIDVAGVDLTIHKSNPIAMLDHGVYYPLPIGLCRNPDGRYLVQKNDAAGEITETTYFSQRSEMAGQVYALIDEGIMNANSIGFDPIEASPISGRGRGGKEGPKVVHKANLIEVTWTPLPVNPEAVRAALAKNVLNGRPMAHAIKSMLVKRVPAAAVRRHWETSGYHGKSAPVATGTAEEDGERASLVFVSEDDADTPEDAARAAIEDASRWEDGSIEVTDVQPSMGGWNVSYRVVYEVEVPPAQTGGDPPPAWQPDVDYPEKKVAFSGPGGESYTLHVLSADTDDGATAYNWILRDPSDAAVAAGQSWRLDLAAVTAEGTAAAESLMAELATTAATFQPAAGKNITIGLAPHVDEDRAVEVAGTLFGDKINAAESVEQMYALMRDEVATATAIPDDSTVEIMKAGDYNPAYSDDVPTRSVGIRAMVKNPKLHFDATPLGANGTGAGFWIGQEETGEKFVRIEWVGVHKDYRGAAGDWILQRMLDGMVENGIANGFGYIGGHAAGDPTSKDSGLNGYLVWPKYGFDESFKDLEDDADFLLMSGYDARAEKITRTLQAARQEFPDAQSILDIYEEDGGDKWWADNGCEFLRMKFDLAEGSRSRDIFSAYYESKVGKSA